MQNKFITDLRDTNNYLPLRNYSKTINTIGRVTGRTLLLNKIKNLAVVDFDIHDHIQTVREDILKIIPKDDTIIVSTPHQGIHVYCENDFDDLLDKNSFVGVFKSNDFNVDIFIGNVAEKQQCLNCPPTKVRYRVGDTEERKVFEYSFINNDFDFNGELIKLSTLLTILIENNIDVSINKLKPVKKEVIEKKVSNTIRDSTNDSFNSTICDSDKIIVDLNFIKDVIDGITECEIHNDARPIKDEVSILPLFCALNSLIKIKGVDEKYLDDVYKSIYDSGSLTENAKESYYRLKSRYDNKGRYCSSYKILLLMLKYHNSVWYDHLKEKYKFQDFIFSNIDLVREVTNCVGFDNTSKDILYDISKKVFDVSKPEEVLIELRKVIAIVPGKNLYFVRTKDIKDTACTKICNSTDFRDSLRLTAIHFNDKTKTNALNIFNDNFDVFCYANYRFFSTDAENLNYFHGYKYDTGIECDISKISRYLNHIKNVIAYGPINHYFEKVTKKDLIVTNDKYFYKFNEDDGAYDMVDDENEATHFTYTSNDDFYEYILNWFAYIIQNIGEKTGVCILLKSNQGSGKNTFTNVLATLLSGYSEMNITSLEDLTSDYNLVLENKKLIICNEICSLAKSKADFEKLKSIWTEKTFRVGDKYIAKREIELPVNAILLTNNLDALKIESSDRRYLCLETSNSVINNTEYFRKLYNEIEQPDFYYHLTSYFKNRNIKNFNPSNVPKTNLKESLKQLSVDAVEEFISENSKLFVNGLPMNNTYDMFYSWCASTKLDPLPKRQFLLHLKTKCYPSLNKDKQHVWKIKKDVN